MPLPYLLPGIGNNYNAVFSDLIATVLAGVGLHSADKTPSPDLKSDAFTKL